MRETILLRKSVMQDIAILMDDNDAMREIHALLTKLINKKERQQYSDVTAETLTVSERDEILYDIKEGLKEVRLAREEGRHLQSAEDFLNEIRNRNQ